MRKSGAWEVGRDLADTPPGTLGSDASSSRDCRNFAMTAGTLSTPRIKGDAFSQFCVNKFFYDESRLSNQNSQLLIVHR